MEASASYLRHVRSAWNFRHSDAPLEDQDLVVTVPASFDEAARALRGRYVFGDYARTFANDGRLFYLARRNLVRGNTFDKSKPVELRLSGGKGLGLSLLGFGQDASGELYVLANATGVPGGSTGVVLKIAP